MGFEKPTNHDQGFSDDEITPDGRLRPGGFKVNIGENVEKLFASNPSPEMLTYTKALFQDMIADYKLMGRQIAETINLKIAELQDAMKKIDKK